MDLLTQIRELLPQLTPGERKAAAYILEYPFDAVRFPSSTIADSANTSRSNVVRFCQKLGFSGYSEFTYALDHSLRGKKHFSGSQEQTAGTETVLQKYLNEFEKLEAFYRSTQLQEIARLITSARRVLVLGQDHSFFSAQQLTFRLNRAGIAAVPTDLPSIMGAYYDMLDHRDVAIIFSVQARKQSYENLLKPYRDKHIKSILITTAKKPSIFGYVDQVVSLPSVTRSHSSDMLDEAPTFYLFIELLLEAIHALPSPNQLPADNSEG